MLRGFCSLRNQIMDTTTEYHLFTYVFNPRRGNHECFLCSVFAHTLMDAKKYGRRELEPGETMILRKAPRR